MIADDDQPKKTPVHEIGMDLSALSIEELKERIELLRSEIERLESDILAKGSTREAAESIFSKS
jgi:uncharacterized small protein (DUF1192 family)